MSSFLEKFFYGVQKAYHNINSVMVIQSIIPLIWNALPLKLRSSIECHPDFDCFRGSNCSVDIEDFTLMLKKHYMLQSDIKLREMDQQWNDGMKGPGV